MEPLLCPNADLFCHLNARLLSVAAFCYAEEKYTPTQNYHLNEN